MVCLFGFCLSPLQFLPIIGFLLIQFYNCYRSLSGMNKKKEIVFEVDENETQEKIIDALIKANLKAHLAPPKAEGTEEENAEKQSLIESSFPTGSYPVLAVPKLFALKALMDWNRTNTNTFLIVKVGATWCPPCRMIGPLYEKLSLDMHTKQAEIEAKKGNDNGSQDDVDNVDSDSEDERVQPVYNVMAIDVDSDDFNVGSLIPVRALPTFFLLSKGEVVDSFTGANEGKLKAMFEGIKFE